MLELLQPAARRISEIGIPAAAAVEVEMALTEYAIVFSQVTFSHVTGLGYRGGMKQTNGRYAFLVYRSLVPTRCKHHSE